MEISQSKIFSPSPTQALVAFAIAAAIFFLLWTDYYSSHCFLKNLISFANFKVPTFLKRFFTSFS